MQPVLIMLKCRGEAEEDWRRYLRQCIQGYVYNQQEFIEYQASRSLQDVKVSYSDYISRRAKWTVAIKKIKTGEMKDGLDMTALREVKFLQELHHPNIIAVSRSSILTYAPD